MAGGCLEKETLPNTISFSPSLLKPLDSYRDPRGLHGVTEWLGLEGILKFTQPHSAPAMGRDSSLESRLLFCVTEQRQKSDFNDTFLKTGTYSNLQTVRVKIPVCVYRNYVAMAYNYTAGIIICIRRRAKQRPKFTPAVLPACPGALLGAKSISQLPELTDLSGENRFSPFCFAGPPLLGFPGAVSNRGQ